MKKFGGEVLFLNRSDINTDEIIPARYLTEVDKKALKPHLLEDLILDDFDPNGRKLQTAGVIVSRQNFGCGSSREHAPWAFEVNGINVVIASGFARIFRQNMYNCGMLAVELKEETIDSILIFAKESSISCAVDMNNKKLTFTENDNKLEIDFRINSFDEALITSGGWVEYADLKY